MLQALRGVCCSCATRRGDSAERKQCSPRHIPCTKGKRTRCQLLKPKHCRYINEILLDAGLEIRDHNPAGHSGDVCIGVVRASACGLVFSSCEDSHKSRALKVVECLLSKHHCITAFELNASARHCPSLLALLKNCRSFRSVTVCTVDRKEDAAFLTHTIGSLTQLKELSFKACNGYREWNWDTWDDQRIPENSLNLLIDNLATLDLTDLEMSLDEARRLVFALQKNDTITDLTLPFCMFRCRLREGCEPLSEYLERTRRLKKLTLRSRTKCCALDEVLVDTMCDMRSVRELNVDIVLDIAYSVIMARQLAEVIARNNYLRRIRLPLTVCRHCASPDGKYTVCTFPKANMPMFPVVSALTRRDSNLYELSVDLAGCNEEECELFFRSAIHDVLGSVTVYSLPSVHGIDRICGIISRFLHRDLVTIKNICVDQTVANVLLYCPEITAVTITASHFLLNEDNLQPVIRALDVISRCGHVTSLRVDCSRFDRAAFSALARCVRGPSPLTEVDINFGSCWTEIVDDECYEIEAELFLALATNMNLAKLSLSGALVSRNNLKLLAGSARKSRYLTDFCLAPVCMLDTWEHGFCTWHAAERSSALPNYKNAALVAIQEITRRNVSLVEAAVQYVLSEKETKTGAQVIELMHSHPRFLEMLRQAANTSKVRAKEMTWDALSRIRKTSLDEFMRLAGVVKKNVNCCGKCGAGKQLVDMRGKCWLHIRSFLKVSDVVRP